MNKLRPIGDRIIVQPDATEEKTSFGLILQETTKPNTGKVVAVGVARNKDGSSRALDISIGDRVMYGKYSGQSFKIDGIEYLTMREDDVIGVIEE